MTLRQSSGQALRQSSGQARADKAELLRETTEAIAPSVLAQYQAQRADIQATLGEVGFSIALLEGRSLSLEQALGLAQGALDASAVG